GILTGSCGEIGLDREAGQGPAVAPERPHLAAAGGDYHFERAIAIEISDGGCGNDGGAGQPGDRPRCDGGLPTMAGEGALHADREWPARHFTAPRIEGVNASIRVGDDELAAPVAVEVGELGRGFAAGAQKDRIAGQQIRVALDVNGLAHGPGYVAERL